MTGEVPTTEDLKRKDSAIEDPVRKKLSEVRPKEFRLEEVRLDK